MANTELNALNKAQAYQLADITKTPPQFGAITPRWLTRFLEFKGLDAGIYRVNKVAEGETPLDVLCSSEKKSAEIPEGYVEYQQKPREYTLNSISTIINVDTAVEDVFSSPYDQTKEQLHLAIESLRERQESQIINNDDYGLLKNVPDSQRITPGNKAGSPCPTIWTNCSQKCGKNRRSFWPTRGLLPLFSVNVHAGAFPPLPRRFLAAHLYCGAAFR